MHEVKTLALKQSIYHLQQYPLMQCACLSNLATITAAMMFFCNLETVTSAAARSAPTSHLVLTPAACCAGVLPVLQPLRL